MWELLGPHRAIVDELIERFEAIRAGDVDGARVVVLRGASGVGKSRIIQEFYERLRLRQSDPEYWPPLPMTRRSSDGERAARDPMAARKILGPDPHRFIWPRGALPNYGWWHYLCDRDYAYGRDIRDESLTLFDVHLVALTLAWAQDQGLLKRNRGAIGQAARDVRDAAVDTGIDKAVEVFSEVFGVLPWGSTLARWGWSGMARVRDERALNRQRLDDFDAGGAAAHARRSVGAEAARTIRSVASSRLPHVVAVEDLHYMNEQVKEFIEALSSRASGVPVLVICTVWPESESREPFATWFRWASLLGAVDVIDVPELSRDELRTIVRWHSPATEDPILDQIVARLRNPHWLNLWLTSGQIQRRIELGNGALVLTPADLDRLPRDLEDIMLLRWKELPEGVRHALTAAMAARLPSAAGFADAGESPRFLRNVVADALAGARPAVEPKQVEESLRRAVEMHWCATEGQVQWIREDPLADCVARSIGDLDEGLAPEEVSELRAAAETSLTGWIEQRRQGLHLSDESEDVVAAQWLTVLVGEPNASSAVQAAFYTTARQLAARYKLMEASTLLRASLDTREEVKEDPETFTARRDLATWLGQSDRVEEAVALLRDLLREQTAVLGEEDPEILTTRGNLTLWLAERGRVEDTIIQFESLLQDQERILGTQHPDTLRTRGNLAVAHWRAGRIVEAVDQSAALLDELTSSLGVEHRDTLATRGNLALWRAELGQFEEAIVDLEALLEDCERWLGEQHPTTLITRLHLATMLGEAGRLDQAVVKLRELVQLQSEYLGRQHRDTLATRGHLAWHLEQSGNVDDALEHFTALVEDQDRVLGAEHSHTLATRHHLASLMTEAGRSEDAAMQFAALLESQIRVLGPQHEDTLRTRRELAYTRAEVGRLEEGVAQLEALLVEQTSVLGPEHPEVLSTRNDLALCLGKSGRVEEAVTQLTALVDERERALGWQHPEILATRSNLASMMGRAGHVTDAVTSFATLLEEQEKKHGARHPETMRTRGSLALWLGEAGDVDEAIVQLEALIKDQDGVLGRRHPDTLANRVNLADMLVRVGAVKEALTHYVSLVEDHEEVFGERHPHTLRTRRGMASCLGMAGRIDEASAQLDALLTDHERVLGAGHPDTHVIRSDLAWMREGERAALSDVTRPEQSSTLHIQLPDTVGGGEQSEVWPTAHGDEHRGC